ncbi:MAG: putative toxin-antitoxin system toxin component, PIN family [Candidatus Omnitrophota bacterium]|jgi:putative PIN family toxin of toxin-antitoxin system
MLKVVPDANILISAMFGFPGMPRQIFNLALKKDIILFGSQETYNEFCEKVRTYQKFQRYWQRQIFTPEKIIVDYKTVINMAPTKGIYQDVCIVQADPSDDIYFKTAKACGAKIIISGDKHLLGVKKFDNILVVKPRNFIDKYNLIKQAQ